MVRKITAQVINYSTVTRDNHRRELDPVPEWLGDKVQEHVEVGDKVQEEVEVGNEVESDQKCAA